MTKRPYNLKTWWKSVAATEGGAGRPWLPPLEANVPTLPLQKSVESKAGKRDLKNT